MKKIVNFKMFYNNEEFVEWQRNNNFVLYSIVPMFNNITAAETDGGATASWTVGCFATYGEAE